VSFRKDRRHEPVRKPAWALEAAPTPWRKGQVSPERGHRQRFRNHARNPLRNRTYPCPDIGSARCQVTSVRFTCASGEGSGDACHARSALTESMPKLAPNPRTRQPRGTRRPRVHRTRGDTVPRTAGYAAARDRDRIAQYRADTDGNPPPVADDEVPATGTTTSIDGPAPSATNEADGSPSAGPAEQVVPRRRSLRPAAGNAARQRRPQVAPVDPQRAVNRRWEQWLARRYPGTRWEIVRDVDVDGRDGVTAADAGQVAGAARVVSGPQTGPGLGGSSATGDGDDLESV
jgi:hypothetical protein